MTHCLFVLYNCMKFHSNSCNGFQLTERTRISIVNDQGQITPKIFKAELWFLHMTHRLICSSTVWSFIQTVCPFFTYINGHKIAFTYVPRGIIWKYTIKSYVSCAWHVVSIICFTNVWSFIYIAVTLFNLKWTRSSKLANDRREIIVKSAKHCYGFCLIVFYNCMKFHRKSLNSYQVIERTCFVTDRQTDRRARGETIWRRRHYCVEWS